ncbi:methyltransferase type 12 [Parafrankia colletiae]|uniref:Methyltransferase type 12 n=1 Tax=Parafrankia colletiae TaxID=573497 RepID=A0A1S1QG28_9ACTN|nr:class I SAM-dependent methyltransferase [Parafrankia colletiae]MCK9898763.1 class I SAM-dependent methyltransferase [Frankia sp. Cpl3]OHV33753.1 methyltransferase type 12 [Parafrankia colletiae]
MWLLVPVLVCLGLVANGIRLRGRLRRLDTVVASGRPVDPAHLFLVAEGVRLPEAARRAASNHARRERLLVLDLVPADLTVERALDVARMVDTRTYRADRSAPGRGAFQAILVHRDLLERAGITHLDGFSPVELVDIATQLKRYAPTATDLAVVPGLRAARDDAAMRVRVQQRAYACTPASLYMPFTPHIATAIGSQVSQQLAYVATALFWFQPFFVCAGRVPLAPRDLIRSPIVRILGIFLLVVHSVRAGREARAAGIPADPHKAARRQRRDETAAWYRARARHVGRLREVTSSECPWCGSRELRSRLRSPDLAMGKPGSFQLDTCGRCGHTFLNPAITPDGQDYYERDWRDGFAAEAAEHARAREAAADRARAELLRPYATPRAWLDVGTGFGHFCNVARHHWPATAFGGLDITDSVDEARARGWVDAAYQGELVQVADRLAGRYDVISMFGYLERARYPSEELDGAVKALAPGGHLLIELPNPSCPAARRLGRYWPGWDVPRRLHFIPVDNLLAALEDRGLRPIVVELGAAQRPGDLTGALGLLIQQLAPKSEPWLDTHRAGPGRRLLRVPLLLASIAPLVLAAVVDSLSRAWLARGSRSNTYRVLARKEG